MDDDQEICRVCRSESTPDHPLYHPCKCSGSIRFVHQDCLLEWLSHSKKKYCELCEYPFVFTPIYREDMPDRIPFSVLFQQCARRSVVLLKTVARAAVVVTVWLVILPLLTLWTWRFYFWSGKNIGFSRRMSSNATSAAVAEARFNATTAEDATEHVTRLFSFTLKGFLSECFEGQIITAFVIIVFVAAYLFREWVIQNTPAETGLELLDENEDQQQRQQQQQQQQAEAALGTMNAFIDAMNADQERRDAVNARIEELRRELIRRRQNLMLDSEGAVMIDRPADNEEASFGHSATDDSSSVSGSEEAAHGSSSFAQESYTDHIQDRGYERKDKQRAVSGEPSGISSKNVFSDGDSDRESYDNDAGTSSSSRQPLLASWREEHDRHDRRPDSSAKRRWRAPEFSASPENDIHGSEERQVNDGYDSFWHETENDAGIHDMDWQHQTPQQQDVHNIDWEPEPAHDEPAGNQWENEFNNNNNNNRDQAAEDDEPFDLGEDIDGLLEAIGMRGNMWMLVQNSVLMSLMISLFMGVAVWIPYVIGRLVILIRPTSFIRTPIAVLQFIVDNMVDFILDYALPYMRSALAPVMDLIPANIREVTDSLLSHFASLTGLFSQVRDQATIVPSPHHANSLVKNGTSLVWSEHMAAFHDKLEAASEVALGRWQQFALGHSGLDRSVCIVVGYIVLVLIGSWYLARSRGMSRGSTAHAVNDLIRQQGVFLKVFLFIVLELVVFPVVCGVLIDLATLPLFDDASVASRWAFFVANPYSGIFLHWFVGTGFMFHFAVFVTLCREIVRPGVMWFIRDPNDPQFHPVQEMIERPILTLMRKIGSSALMYSVLIVAGIGAVTLLVSQYTGVYPLRWSYNTPLSSLALDLLAVQFLVPPLIAYIKPREFAKKVLSDWWRASSRYLRLSSFMFNGRYPEEEGTHVRRTFKAWILREKAPVPPAVYSDVAIDETPDDAPVVFRRDGGLARVPKHDSVPVVDNRRMIVPINPITLEPLDEEERRRGHPAASESGDEENNTTVVYVPPRFKLRIISFLLLMWVSGSLLTCSITVVPLLLGRHIFEQFIKPGTEVQDMYAFILGAYIMAFLSLVINWFGQKFDALTRTGGQIDFTEVKAHIVQRGQKILKAVYFGTAFGLVIPLLLGIALELYALMPFQTTKEEEKLVIHISEDWSFGVVFVGIAHGIIYLLPANALQRHLDATFGNDVFRANTWAVTRSIIIPVVGTGVCAVAVPGTLSILFHKILGITDPAMQIALFRCAYPLVFCLAVVIGMCVLGMKVVNMWLKSVRDDTYLVGRRLHNLQEPGTPVST